jgi:Family of unknown function (DUF5715)
MRRFVLCMLMVSSLLANASLRGSKSSLKKQNEEADRENLTRIENDGQLERFKRLGLLVKLPENQFVRIDPRLEPKWRWCRRPAAAFLRDLGREYFKQFHEQLQINSAVRTVEYQRQLRKSNGNATAADGEDRSSHLTGATIDLAKKNMSSDEKKWMRKKLLDFKARDLIEPIEERKQACFHVMVFKSYHGGTVLPQTPRKKKGN